jgi:Sec-independent protein translocase protein TatA
MPNYKKCALVSCGKAIIGKVSWVKCSGPCKGHYHPKCVHITEEKFEEMKKKRVRWNCPQCSPNLNDTLEIVNPDDVDSNTSVINYPVIILSENATEITHTLQSENAPDRTPTDPIIEISSLEANVLDTNQSSLDKIASYLKVLALSFIEIKKTQEVINGKFNSFLQEKQNIEEENSKLRDRLVEVEKSNIMLSDRLGYLENKIDEPEREKIKNNVIIAGLPSKLPDAIQAVMNISKKIKSNIRREDIIEVKKIEQRDKTKNIRCNYILKLRSSEAKKELMEKKKKFSNIFTAELELDDNENKEVFLRHHLTPFQANLYHEARKFKQEFKYRFLWVNDGQILLRQDGKTKVYNIQSLCDLNRCPKN